MASGRIDNGVQYFYKIAEDNYGVVIAIDAVTKQLLDAECRVITFVTDKELEKLELDDSGYIENGNN